MTQPIPTTLDGWRDLLRLVVNKKGEDYIYRPEGLGCRNFDAYGRPGCIFGHAYAELGLDAGRVGTTSTVTSVLRDLGTELGTDEIYLLQRVQEYQDGGKPWGVAIKALDVE